MRDKNAIYHFLSSSGQILFTKSADSRACVLETLSLFAPPRPLINELILKMFED